MRNILKFIKIIESFLEISAHFALRALPILPSFQFCMHLLIFIRDSLSPFYLSSLEGTSRTPLFRMVSMCKIFRERRNVYTTSMSKYRPIMTTLILHWHFHLPSFRKKQFVLESFLVLSTNQALNFNSCNLQLTEILREKEREREIKTR